MNILLIFTILLLIISLINNYFMFNNKFNLAKSIESTEYIDSHYIPNNIGYTTYTIFFNRNKYPNVCHINNEKNDKKYKKSFAEILFDDNINDLLNNHNDKLYIIKNKNNINNIKLNEEQAKSISNISY
jgi:hypothetical protein